MLDRTLAEVASYRDEPPEERIHVLVDHLFLRSVVARDEVGIVQEMIALSLHRPAIRAKLSKYYNAMLAHLNDLFLKVPRQPGLSAADAANIAAALWQGFFTDSQYDPNLANGRARRLFRRTLFSLANIRSTVQSSQAVD